MRKDITVLVTAVALLQLVLGAYAADKKDKADQITRDVQRLSQIKTIAVLPVVAQIHLDNEDRIDPNRMAMRQAVAIHIPTMLEDRMKSGNYTLLPPEAATLAMKEGSIEASDVFVTQSTGSWETPADKINNKEQDVVLLRSTRDEMKKNPEVTTLYSYTAHDLPGSVIGLASYKLMLEPKLNVDKIKSLGQQLKADAILICRISELEIHQTGNGSIAFPLRRTTEVTLDFTLISPSDGAILWEARAKGSKGAKGGVAGGLEALRRQDIAAIDGASIAVDSLLDDLVNGTGKQAK